jgi:hypothetical protein
VASRRLMLPAHTSRRPARIRARVHRVKSRAITGAPIWRTADTAALRWCTTCCTTRALTTLFGVPLGAERMGFRNAPKSRVLASAGLRRAETLRSPRRPAPCPFAPAAVAWRDSRTSRYGFCLGFQWRNPRRELQGPPTTDIASGRPEPVLEESWNRSPGMNDTLRQFRQALLADWRETDGAVRSLSDSMTRTATLPPHAWARARHPARHSRPPRPLEYTCEIPVSFAPRSCCLRPRPR